MPGRMGNERVTTLQPGGRARWTPSANLLFVRGAVPGHRTRWSASARRCRASGVSPAREPRRRECTAGAPTTARTASTSAPSARASARARPTSSTRSSARTGCCEPASAWSTSAAGRAAGSRWPPRRSGPSGRVVGVDLAAIEPPLENANVIAFQGDLAEPAVVAALLDALGGPADVAALRRGAQADGRPRRRPRARGGAAARRSSARCPSCCGRAATRWSSSWRAPRRRRSTSACARASSAPNRSDQRRAARAPASAICSRSVFAAPPNGEAGARGLDLASACRCSGAVAGVGARGAPAPF